jgi:hypothetical protein
MTLRAAASLIILPVLASLALGGCAWYGGKPEVPVSEVLVKTNPPGADCELVGANEYRADVSTPARIKVRNDASPLLVTCSLAGYRPAHGTLSISTKGWLTGTTDAIADISSDSLAAIGFDSGDSSPSKPQIPVFNATLKPLVQTMIKQ